MNLFRPFNPDLYPKSRPLYLRPVPPGGFDPWQAYIGKGFDARLFAKLDWSLHQKRHGFYICAGCGLLWAHLDRPHPLVYDICWHCTTETKLCGKRHWLRALLDILLLKG